MLIKDFRFFKIFIKNFFLKNKWKFLIKTNDTSSYHHIISSYENEENKKKKNKEKCQFFEVWQYIKYGKEKSSGNYEGTCTFYREFWDPAKPAKLKIHLAKSCSKYSEDV